MTDTVPTGGPSATDDGSPAARVDLGPLLSPLAREVVDEAARLSAEQRGADVDSRHLLWAATRQPALRAVLAGAGVDPDELARRVEALADTGLLSAPTEPPQLSPTSRRALLDSHRISEAEGSALVQVEHLLLGLAADERSSAGRLLRDALAAPGALQRALDVGTGADGTGPGTTSITPLLDTYGHDLCALARLGKLDVLVGRAAEVEQVLEVLARRTRNNPVLIGEPGVGKTAVVEGIAQRVVAHDVPESLVGRRVVQLDLVELASTEAKQRVTDLLAEIREHGADLIIFVNELHTVLGAPGDGGAAVGRLLRSALARGDLHLVAATTFEDYRNHIERNAVLQRRFVPVPIVEATEAETVRILRGLRHRYEAYHGVRLTDAALDAAARLSARYLTDRRLPEKAIDLLDQAGSHIQLRARAPQGRARGLEQQLEQLHREHQQAEQDGTTELAALLNEQIGQAGALLEAVRATRAGGPPEVGAADVAAVVSRMTGVPIAQMTEGERERLARLEGELTARVVGQAAAAAAVAEAVRRSRTGLADPARPIGSFLFVGPSGVGKTELARALAVALFGDEARLVQVDLNAYTDQTSVGRLVGRPAMPGRSAEAGVLADGVRKQPYSVVLLEDIDRAHNDVYTQVVQVLDAGRLVDGHGRTVDFRNTVVIMTTCVGQEDLAPAKRLGFGTGQDGHDGELRRRLRSRLRTVLPAQFLDRVDDLAVLHHLGDAELRMITRLLVEQTCERMRAQGVTVAVDEAAVDWLVARGTNPDDGARPLRRLVRQQLDDRLAALLVSWGPVHPARVRVGVDHGAGGALSVVEEPAGDGRCPVPGPGS